MSPNPCQNAAARQPSARQCLGCHKIVEIAGDAERAGVDAVHS